MTYDFAKGIDTLVKRDKNFELLVNQLGFIKKKKQNLEF